jgi:hypothetical protein
MWVDASGGHRSPFVTSPVVFVANRCNCCQANTIVDSAVETSAGSAFHSDDVEHVASYQSLSILAIFSLIVGLLSPLCLLWSGFLALPLVGIVLSLLAIRRIATSDGQLAGRGAAIAGLSLCVAFGVMSFSHQSITRYLRSNQAEEFGREWLALIAANDTNRAFKATYDGNRPLPPPEPGAPAPTTTPYEDFLSSTLIKKILAAGKDAKIQFADTLEFTWQAQSSFLVKQRFNVTPQTGDADSRVAIDLTMHRARYRGEAIPRWLVTSFEMADVPAK